MLSRLLLIPAVAFAQSVKFDYVSYGEDWPRLKIEGNMCDDSNQSPIDLKTTGWNVVMNKEDNYNRIYQDLTGGGIQPKWNGYTTKLDINLPGKLQVVNTEIGKKYYQAGKRFMGTFIQFRHESEHTVDGKKLDMEVQVTHDPYDPSGNVKQAKTGILFSVERFSIEGVTNEMVKTIDEFFDSLQWDKNDPIVDYVPVGKFMRMIDMSERWVYKGS